ncbi:putative membrane protein [Lachnospiraceae bacterium PFB1-21]
MGQAILKMINNLLGEKGYYIAEETIPGIMVIGISIFVGLLVCFFGLKLKRILSVFAAIIFAALTVAVVFLLLDVTAPILGGVALVSLILYIVLAIKLPRFGIFMMIFLYAFSVVIVLLQAQDTTMLLICVGVAFVVALITAIVKDPLIMIITGLGGGLAVGQNVGMLLGQTGNLLLVYGVSAGLAIIGIIVQFMSHSKQLVKREKEVVESVKKDSLESEMEEARQILLDDDEDDEN